VPHGIVSIDVCVVKIVAKVMLRDFEPCHVSLCWLVGDHLLPFEAEARPNNF
jgi:hypothetical protein